MSAGLVMCSACSREVHQNGPRYAGRATWLHCESGSPMCEGATATYATRAEIKGRACFRDELSTRPPETVSGWTPKEKRTKPGAPKAPRSERKKR